MLSRFSQVWLYVSLWTAACQAPLSMGFSRQEYWSGLPCPPPGDHPSSGTEPVSPRLPALTGGLFATSTIWGARLCCPPSFPLSQFLQQYFTVTCDLTQPCGRGQRGSTLSYSDEASVLSWHHVPESADVVLSASSVPTVLDLYVLLPFLRVTALFLLLSSAAMVFPQCPKSEHLLPFPLQLKVFKGERIWVGFHTFLTLAAIPLL